MITRVGPATFGKFPITGSFLPEEGFKTMVLTLMCIFTLFLRKSQIFQMLLEGVEAWVNPHHVGVLVLFVFCHDAVSQSRTDRLVCGLQACLMENEE